MFVIPGGLNSHVCRSSHGLKKKVTLKFRQANQRGATKVMQDSFTYERVNVEMLPLMHQHLQHVCSKHVGLICTYGIQTFESRNCLIHFVQIICSIVHFLSFIYAQTISLDVNVVLPGLIVSCKQWCAPYRRLSVTTPLSSRKKKKKIVAVLKYNL